LHHRYERDRKLVAAKKDAVRAATGGLACEVCGFDSRASYGIEGVVDVHHVLPLNQRGEGITGLRACSASTLWPLCRGGSTVTSGPRSREHRCLGTEAAYIT